MEHALPVDLGLVDGRLPVWRAFLLEAGVGAEGNGFLHAGDLLLPARRQRLNAGRLSHAARFRVVDVRQQREVSLQSGIPCERGAAEVVTDVDGR